MGQIKKSKLYRKHRGGKPASPTAKTALLSAVKTESSRPIPGPYVPLPTFSQFILDWSSGPDVRNVPSPKLSDL